VYKLLLCWRYLLTRYLALICVVSVMLGVATLIVVNSVMSGFSTKLKDRLHGLLSDVIVEANTYDGFPDAEGKMERIRRSEVGDRIAAMTPTLEVFAMITYPFQGQMVMRPVHLIGIEPEGRAKVGGFAEYLVRQKGSQHPTFDLTPEIRKIHDLKHPPYRPPHPVEPIVPGGPPPIDPPPSTDMMPPAVYIGHAIASYREKGKPGQPPRDEYVLLPGDEVILTTVSGQKLVPVYRNFVVVDEFKSEMSECDANYVYVPLDYLQHLRTMEGRVTSIQIRLKDPRDGELVRNVLRDLFPSERGYTVSTWEDKQGALLAAISIEKGILNILLFLIIAVAGFGILSIFSMIVVEKTRDIGILKALGASDRGVMSIFLSYGLLLGSVGAALGTVLGVTFTVYINEIEKWLTRNTGHEIFDRSIYYFDKIPTDIQPLTVVLVVLGALVIAVLASILPALRAALLHPVRALRYE
jgi:lipoprotein-releasing system permease protein